MLEMRCIMAGLISSWVTAVTVALPLLTQAVDITPYSTVPASIGTISSKQNTLNDLAEELWKKHQVELVIACITLCSYISVLWIKPLWLLKLPSTDISVPWTTWKIPLGIVGVLKYRDRVLDSWVKQHWETCLASFSKLPTVEEREIHIVLPVYLNKKFIDELDGKALATTFLRKPAVLLITGEGGAGKTSLACQIAKWGLAKQLSTHLMLPVLIEIELDEKRSLFEVIRGQINALTNQRDPIESELLKKLLNRQRILVIVDHFSEMSEVTRKQVTPDLAEFPVKALVVTSRLNESLGGVPKTVLEPLRIEGSRLSRFMDIYLEQRKKRDLFEDEDYFDACRRLSRIVGQRNITLLLAKLYADQMIEQQQGAGGNLPASVPELMLSYINQLNRTIEPANQQEYLQVQQDAQRVAWECLKQTYRPTAANKVDILSALGEQGNGNVQMRLAYLEKRLQLLQTLEPGNKIRFILDPLAEYLAALSLVTRSCNKPETYWQQFLNSIDTVLEDTNDPPEAIQGFLLAVRDCCILQQKEASVPEQLIETLAYKAGFDPKELRRIEEQRRIRLLISELSAPELEYRIRAAEDLGDRGVAAAAAVPNLLGMVKNFNQNLVARQAAVQALGKIGNSSDTLKDNIVQHLILLLKNNNDELAVLRSTAEVLGTMKAGEVELRRILVTDDFPLPLRQGASKALSHIGATNGASIPMLIVHLKSGQLTTEVSNISVYKESLQGELTLDLVAIPEGKFLMGSPLDEEGRNWYRIRYPELEETDVEQQHQVSLQGFWMSRYLITQSQWKVVANFPKIEREIDPEPANFKNDDFPVECISYYDAIEFCARLSQHTGRVYRLPSEAEWEYACRADTVTPFHFGDTISIDFVNYDSNYNYTAGGPGENRQTTTEVGAFGVVNAFGLSDMHGNLWEWCLDFWHPSYHGAPTDGSAWLIATDVRSYTVRGGCWGYGIHHCRSASRDRRSPETRSIAIGFRVACQFF